MKIAVIGGGIFGITAAIILGKQHDVHLFEKNDDKFTISIREFNKFVSKDKRVEQVIIPLGDGMTVCRKL